MHNVLFASIIINIQQNRCEAATQSLGDLDQVSPVAIFTRYVYHCSLFLFCALFYTKNEPYCTKEINLRKPYVEIGESCRFPAESFTFVRCLYEKIPPICRLLIGKRIALRYTASISGLCRDSGIGRTTAKAKDSCGISHAGRHELFRTFRKSYRI